MERGAGRDHPAGAAARRRGRRRPGRAVRHVGEGARATRRCAAWWSAARCSTRRTATSPRAVDAVGGDDVMTATATVAADLHLRARLGGRGRCSRAGQPRVGRLGVQRPARCSTSRPVGRVDLVDRRGRDAGAVAVRRRAAVTCDGETLRRATGAPTSSAGPATSSTCRATRERDDHQRRAAAGSRCRPPCASGGCRSATSRPTRCRSSCAAPARPAGRSTTSAPPRRSRPTR